MGSIIFGSFAQLWASDKQHRVETMGACWCVWRPQKPFEATFVTGDALLPFARFVRNHWELWAIPKYYGDKTLSELWVE